MAATNSDSFDGSGQSQLKTSWKGCTIKDIYDSWKKVKNINITLMDDFEGFNTSVEEIIADVVEIAR